MLKSKALLGALALCAVTLVVTIWWSGLSAETTAQPTATELTPDAQALTPEDYAEIRHLYARYAQGIDSKAENGALYASVFLPDSQFINQHTESDPYDQPDALVGLEALTKQYGRSRTGEPSDIGVSHPTWNVMIEPAPWGAIGRAYMHDGYYVDTIVKSPQGWRFKHRNFRMDFPDAPDSFHQTAPRRRPPGTR